MCGIGMTIPIESEIARCNCKNRYALDITKMADNVQHGHENSRLQKLSLADGNKA
jgi:hypothetical protein